MRYLITSVNWSGIGHVLAASLPVVISAIVTYIAAQQYAVNRRQHRLALFEKRSTGIHLSGKPCRLRRSTQHLLGVYSLEFEILEFFLDVDSIAARPGRAAIE